MSKVDSKSDTKTKTTSAKAKAPEAKAPETPKEPQTAPKETKKATPKAPKEAATSAPTSSAAKAPTKGAAKAPAKGAAKGATKETATKETATKEGATKEAGTKETSEVPPKPTKKSAPSTKSTNETKDGKKEGKKEGKKKRKAEDVEAPAVDPNVTYPEPPITKRSSYAFFTKDKRAAYDVKHPDATFGEKTRMVAKEWNELPAAAKKVYETMAEKDVERYREERAVWEEAVQKLGGNPANILRDRREKKKQRKMPKVKEPKRPRNAYVLFAVAKRGELGGKTKDKSMTFKDIATFLSDEWKKATDADKAKYEKLAEADKVRYTKEMEQFSLDHPEVKKGVMRKHKPKREGEPTRPRNGYLFYCDEERKKLKAEKPDMVPKELMTELGKMWSKLPEVEKSKYYELAQKDKVRYEQDKSAWETKVGAK